MGLLCIMHYENGILAGNGVFDCQQDCGMVHQKYFAQSNLFVLSLASRYQLDVSNSASSDIHTKTLRSQIINWHHVVMKIRYPCHSIFLSLSLNTNGSQGQS